MRKQYHFRPSERGLLAWDVDRLIERTKHLPSTRVPLATIREIDEVYWFDQEGDRPTCRKIVEHVQLIMDADLANPIILSAEGLVMDGMHRIAKALLAGRDTILAVRLESDPEPDYVGRGPRDLPY